MITLRAIDVVADREAVVDLMTGNHFPFHVVSRPSREQVVSQLETEQWRRASWIVDDDLGRVGIARIVDIGDEVGPYETPMLDLRLAEGARGRGLGMLALRALTAQVFSTLPVRRFEGSTRADNIAMRRVFTACGWVQEAQYREAWPVPGHAPVDAVGYAILRREWAAGELPETLPASP